MLSDLLHVLYYVMMYGLTCLLAFHVLVLVIIVLICVLLHLAKTLLRFKLQDTTNENVKTIEYNVKFDFEEKEKQEGEKREKSVREKVLDALRLRKQEIDERDLKRVEREMTIYFDLNRNNDYSVDLEYDNYYKLIDIRGDSDARVVVVGDIHCDYYSLAAILLKLSVSNYDYFEKAYFVFLGDYLDRGNFLFEPLLLLMDLKKILGERMIMLKGNHELISYELEECKVKSKVFPCQSSECLNEFCDSFSFLENFANYYRTLPIYVYLKTKEKTILLVHAAIPRDVNADRIKFAPNDGAIVFDNKISRNCQLKLRNLVLDDMIWGDPKDVDEKMQVEGRFEFGRKQFENFLSRNRIDMLIRSHEAVVDGFKSFFGNRLFTLFSTGGEKNPQTGYTSVEPAFAIIQNAGCRFENSFIYRIDNDEKTIFANPFFDIEYSEKHCKLDDEFRCDEETMKRIDAIARDIRSGFTD